MLGRCTSIYHFCIVRLWKCLTYLTTDNSVLAGLNRAAIDGASTGAAARIGIEVDAGIEIHSIQVRVVSLGSVGHGCGV